MLNIKLKNYKIFYNLNTLVSIKIYEQIPQYVIYKNEYSYFFSILNFLKRKKETVINYKFIKCPANGNDNIEIPESNIYNMIFKTLEDTFDYLNKDGNLEFNNSITLRNDGIECTTIWSKPSVELKFTDGSSERLYFDTKDDILNYLKKLNNHLSISEESIVDIFS